MTTLAVFLTGVTANERRDVNEVTDTGGDARAKSGVAETKAGVLRFMIC